MGELKAIYDIAGSDAEKVLARFGGNEEMLKHFLCLFAQDSSFSELQAALAAGNTEEAFRAVHTLKGICANLGFERLYEKASTMTEFLRRGELENTKPLFPGLAGEYETVMEALNQK